MLVLTRKIGEGITIGDDIKVVVMQVKGKQVRLGIKAPQGTSVHREEVFERIQEENRLASKSSPENLVRAGNILRRIKTPSQSDMGGETKNIIDDNSNNDE